MTLGTFGTLALIWLSPTVQVDLLGRPDAWFPLKNPALVTIPLGFLAGIAVSLLSPEPAAAARYAEIERRMHTGEERAEGAPSEPR
jgi:cation/acetate symporter